MWYILLFQATIILIPTDLISIQTYGLELAINQFLLLGIIPGTNIAITFNWLIVGLWIVFFYWLTTKLAFGLHQKHRLFKKIDIINRSSL